MFSGQSVNGVTTTELRNDLLADEGLREEFRFGLYVRVSDFTTAPDVDDVLSVDGDSFIVIAKGTGGVGQMIRLDMGEVEAV